MGKTGVASALSVGIVLMLSLCSLAGVSSVASAALPTEWQVETPMAKNCTQAVVVQDEDGIVYVMGGVREFNGMSYGPMVPDVASFDPATGEWNDLSPMDVGVRGAAGALGSDGRIYVFGGANYTVSSHQLTQIYDPATDSWSYGAAVPLGVWEAKAVQSDREGEIVVAGGEGAMTAVQIYDIASDSWSSGNAMPVGLHAGAFFNSGYYSYYIGGSDISYNPSDVVLRYDSYYDSWSLREPMPEPISSLAATVGPDGLVYVVGGGDTSGNVGVGYDTAYCFNPSAQTWKRVADLPTGAKYLGAAASDNGKVYAIGGNNASEVFSQVLSLHVMDVSARLSSAEVSPGEKLTVTFEVELANTGEIEGAEYYAHIIDSDGVPVNPVHGWFHASSSCFAFELDVPESAEPGEYAVYAFMYVETETIGLELPAQELPFTVIAAATTEELIDDLGDDIAEQMDNMSEQIDALLDELEDMRAEMDDLKDAVNETQQSTDDVGAAVDGKMDGSLGIVVLILLVVVLILALVSMLTARKSAVPPPP